MSDSQTLVQITIIRVEDDTYKVTYSTKRETAGFELASLPQTLQTLNLNLPQLEISPYLKSKNVSP